MKQMRVDTDAFEVLAAGDVEVPARVLWSGMGRGPLPAAVPVVAE